MRLAIAEMPPRKWDKDKVKSAIRLRKAEGKDLSDRATRLEDSALSHAAYNLFGNWSKALEATGIDPLEHVRQKPFGYWTKERIVAEIQRMHRNGQVLNAGVACRESGPVYDAAGKEFHTWRAAVEAAGYDYDKTLVQKRWSKERVIREIKERVDRGLQISAGEVNRQDWKLYAAGQRHFGDWYSAVEAAGFPRSSVTDREKWTKDRIIKEIKELDLSGEDLSLSYNYVHRSRLLAAATRYFGTWEKAVEEAGIPYDEERRQHKYYSKDEIASSIGEYEGKGYDLSWVSFRGTNSRLAAAARKRFGNWETAVRAAGFDYDQIRRNWYLETFKGTLFEEYVRELFDVLGRRVDYQRIFRFEDESCIPDFYDQDSGLWIDAKLDTWGVGVVPTIEKYLRHTNRLQVIYLKGRRRVWQDRSIEFIPIRQFYPELIAKGATELKDRIESLRRGILRPEQRIKLEEFISTVSPEDKEEILKSILTART